MQDSLLRALVDLRDRQIQKTRIQFGNRLSAIERAADEDSKSGQEVIVERYFNRFAELEEAIEADITDIVGDHPMYEQLSAIKGIGPMLAAKLIAMIDIERAHTVSSLWRFAGFGLYEYWQDEDGEIVAPKEGWKYVKKGEDKERVRVRPDPKGGWTLVEIADRAIGGWCRPWNARLKTTCYLVGTSFLKANSPYRDEYDRAKGRYQQERPDWNKLHVHRAAMRNMIKLFLAHLWERWREVEGLATRPPYVIEYGGHTSQSDPVDYGWPVQ